MRAITTFALGFCIFAASSLGYANSKELIVCQIELQKSLDGQYTSVGEVSYEVNPDYTPAASVTKVIAGLDVLCSYDPPPAKLLACSFAVPRNTIGWDNLNEIQSQVVPNLKISLSEFEHTSRAGFASSRITCAIR